MKEHVVYIIGAGFSAPLGIPVMGNFLEKSKDMYFSKQVKDKHFSDVFEMIREMSYCKTFYDADLTNIEEILSILEMKSYLGNDDLKSSFIQYITDVVGYYTPEIPPLKTKLPSNWEVAIFPPLWNNFAYFISSLLQLEISERPGARPANIKEYLQFDRFPSKQTEYSIISLNYDLVFENICNYINNEYSPDIQFTFSNQSLDDDSTNPRLVKLHGSIDKGNIIPPTWNKGIGNESIQNEWKSAYSVLSKANYIRIVGYSLPITDSYIKYLLKAAVIESQHLKKIDVLCLDSDGSVKNRYKEFIDFKSFRFVSERLEKYLQSIKQETTSKKSLNEPLKFDQLERTHESFFATH